MGKFDVCPSCGESEWLQFDNVKVESSDDSLAQVRADVWTCDSCGTSWKAESGEIL